MAKKVTGPGHRPRSGPREKPQRIADELRGLIVEGQLKEGDSLGHESDLVERFGVSRPSLREALRILEAEGLITVVRGVHGGVVVHQPDQRMTARTAALVLQARNVPLTDVFDARGIIEPAAARLVAAGRSHRGAARTLRSLIAAQDEVIDDPDEFGRANARFHETLVDLAGNETLTIVAEMLNEIVARAVTAVSRNEPSPDSATTRRRGIRSQERLADLIEAGRTGRGRGALANAHVRRPPGDDGPAGHHGHRPHAPHVGQRRDVALRKRGFPQRPSSGGHGGKRASPDSGARSGTIGSAARQERAAARQENDMARATPERLDPDGGADWHRRVVDRSLRSATQRSIDRGASLIQAAATLLERSNGDGFTVQDVADEAGQSLRTLYQYFESKDDLLLAVFEEAMRTYAGMLRRAIEGIDDPLERLAGAILAALRMPEFSGTGVTRGLARLRLKLTEVEPDLVGRAQVPVNSLLLELIEAAVEAEQLPPTDVEAATFMVMSLNAAFITSNTLGNDSGMAVPEVGRLAAFCLNGLGAPIDDARLADIEGRLKLRRRPVGLDPASSDRTRRTRR